MGREDVEGLVEVGDVEGGDGPGDAVDDPHLVRQRGVLCRRPDADLKLVDAVIEKKGLD